MQDVWGVDYQTAREWLRDDACKNINSAARELKVNIDHEGTLFDGISVYHSYSPDDGDRYVHEVIKAMDKKGLLTDNSPLNLKW